MATQTQIQNHSDLIDSILDDFDEFMESASKTLENKVAARILETNTVDELLALRIPLTEDYRTLVSERVREYIAEFDALAVDSIAMVGDGVTPLDNRVASELKAQAYARLDETTNQNRNSYYRNSCRCSCRLRCSTDCRKFQTCYFRAYDHCRRFRNNSVAK